MSGSLLKILGALVGATVVGQCHGQRTFSANRVPRPFGAETNCGHHYDDTAVANTTVLHRASEMCVELHIKLLVGAMAVAGDQTHRHDVDWLRSSTQTSFTCSANSSVPRAPVETNCVHHYDDTAIANATVMYANVELNVKVPDQVCLTPLHLTPPLVAGHTHAASMPRACCRKWPTRPPSHSAASRSAPRSTRSTRSRGSKNFKFLRLWRTKWSGTNGSM